MSFLGKFAFEIAKGAIGSVTGPWVGVGLDVLGEVIAYQSDEGSDSSPWAGQYSQQVQSRKTPDVTTLLDVLSEKHLLLVANALSNNGEKWNIDKTSKETVLLSIRNNSKKNEQKNLLIEFLWEGKFNKSEESEENPEKESSNLVSSEPAEQTPAWVHLGEGLSYYYLKQYGEAIRRYSKALEIDPSFKLAYVNRGVAYHYHTLYDYAIADYNKAIELDPCYQWPYLNRGLAYFAQEQYTQAINDFNKALELDPNNTSALQNKQLAYANRGYLKKNKLNDTDGAIEDYTIALTLNPDDAIVLCNRGNSLRDKGDINGALNDYNKTVELAPDWGRGYASRGYLLLYHMGEIEKALADFNIALTIDPEDAITYTNRGNAKVRMGDGEGAQADFAMADSLNSGNVSS